MNEQVMWAKLKEAGLFGERITDRLAEGVPDVIALNSQGHAVWIELKAPKSLTGQTGLRTDQAVWLWRWVKHGGLAVVLVARPNDTWELHAPTYDMGWARKAVDGTAVCHMFLTLEEVLVAVNRVWNDQGTIRWTG